MVARELGVSKNMTAREAAIVSAYTGVLIGNFDNLHEYAEEIMGRPVYTHEFANKNFFDCLKEKSRDDFLSILVAPPKNFRENAAWEPTLALQRTRGLLG